MKTLGLTVQNGMAVEGKVRLGANARHLARFTPDQLCPCCTGGLTRVRRDLADVSRAVARPLPAALVQHLGPLLNALRQSGRPVFEQLAKSLQDGRSLPSCNLFEASVTALISAIDRLIADGWLSRLSADDSGALSALRSAFGQILQSIQIFMTELEEAGAETPGKFESKWCS